MPFVSSSPFTQNPFLILAAARCEALPRSGCQDTRTHSQLEQRHSVHERSREIAGVPLPVLKKSRGCPHYISSDTVRRLLDGEYQVRVPVHAGRVVS